MKKGITTILITFFFTIILFGGSLVALDKTFADEANIKGDGAQPSEETHFLPESIRSVGKGGNLAEFAKSIYKYSLGIIGLFAFGAIVFGAVKWSISGVNPSQLSDAKSWINGALLGLGLLLGAYVILNFINPNLVNLKPPELKNVKVDVPATKDPWKATTPEDVKSIPELISSLNPEIYSNNPEIAAKQEDANIQCAYDCQKITVPNIKNGVCQNHICSAAPSVVSSLDELYNYTTNNGSIPSNWQVTEAWPPDVFHSSLCHYNGNCVDIKLTTAPTQAKVNALIKAAEKAGFKVLNEYPEFGGTNTGTSNGSHLHLYK